MSGSACRLTIFNLKFQFKTFSLSHKNFYPFWVQLYLIAQRCPTQGPLKVDQSFHVLTGIGWKGDQNLTYDKLIVSLQSLVLSLKVMQFLPSDSQYISVVPFNIKKMICTSNLLVKLTLQENIPHLSCGVQNL